MEARGLLSRISVRGIPTDVHNETALRRSRTPPRRSNQSRAQSSTTAASKTKKASGESIRARAPATVEYGNGLERSRRRRAQRRRPPPDTRTGTRAFNALVVFSPNMPSHGKHDRKRAPVLSFFLQPSPPNNPERVRTREAGIEHLIRTPSRHPGSTLWIAWRHMASDPRLDVFPSWGRVGRRMATQQPLRRICRGAVQACNR